MEQSDGHRRRFGNVALDVVHGVKEQIDIEGHVERSPYAAIAAALGVGYVLGGGLFSPLTARAVGFGLRLGLRLAIVPLLTEQVLEVAQSVLAGEPPGELLSNNKIPSHNGGGGI